MKKLELLAPAGSFEALVAAVTNGCDAVYLGGSRFGARAFANNFDEEEMIKGIAYAHMYGVQVYVTMNTIFYEDEMDDALAYASFLYSHDVDAIIVQDLGFMKRVHEFLPELELHASTQMHVHNEEAIALVKEYGVKRVVLPRETSLEDIKRLSTKGVDIEAFVHGALCVSYSGQCLMSSHLKGRSGNRGECAQHCRMRYTLYQDDKQIQQDGQYLLSPKDLCTIEEIPSLIQSGITSFKIEGRMKRAAYVGEVVKAYRNAIDAYLNKETFNTTKAIGDMQQLFYRGFTKGRMFHEMGSAFVQTHRPNHMGVQIGEVLRVHKEKVTIKLEKGLHQFDGIRFIQKNDVGGTVQKIYKDGLLVKEAYAKDTIQVDMHEFIEVGAPVHKTTDYVQLKEFENSEIKRKVSIKMHIYLLEGEPMKLQVEDEEGFLVEECSEVLVERAHSTPLLEERILQQLSKVGSTIFSINNIKCTIGDGITVPISKLNELRRTALDTLQKKREVRHGDRSIPNERVIPILQPVPQDSEVMVVVNDEKQLEAALQFLSVRIYCNHESLYEAYKGNSNVYLRSSRIHYKGEYPKDVFTQDIGGLNKAYIADKSIPCVNSSTISFLKEQGVSEVVLSSELQPHQEEILVNQTKAHMRLAKMVYGVEELMTMDYCVVNRSIVDNNKENCRLCKQERRYTLQDEMNDVFVLQGDDDCRMHMYDKKVINHLDNLAYYEELGIQTFYCFFLHEDAQKVKSVLSKLIRK